MFSILVPGNSKLRIVLESLEDENVGNVAINHERLMLHNQIAWN